MFPLVRLRALLAVVAAAAVALPVLSVATPTVARADGPDTVVGELVQAWPEFSDADEAASRAEEGPLSWVETPNGDSVRVPTDQLPDTAGLSAGAVVEVTLGGDVRDGAAQKGLEPARTVVDVEVLQAAPALAASTGGTNQVTVVMVQPGGVPTDGRRLSDVVGAVDGPVRSFWAEQTGGQVQLQVTGQHDWMVTTATCSAPSSLWNEVASAVGWVGGPGKHLLLYVSRAAPGCGAGLAQVGTGVGGGGRLWVTDVLTSLFAHELGHNFSLGHASARQCDASVDAGACTVNAYEDGYDVMGYSWSEVGTLGAPHAARLGVLPNARVVSLAAGAPATTVTLAGVSAPSGVRAVRLTDGAGTEYWVELRLPVGRDDWLGTPRDVFGLGAGVLLRQTGSGQHTSLLLDTTPSAAAQWAGDSRVALRAPGESVVFAGGRFRVELTSMTSTGAQIRVLDPAGAGPTPQPIVALHPIDALQQAYGGNAGALGPATGALICGLPAWGCTRPFIGGLIAWTPTTGAQVVGWVEVEAWRARGGEGGMLGYPVGGLRCNAVGSCSQDFQYGQLVRNTAERPSVIYGATGARWRLSGGVDGPLRRPLSDEVCGLRDGGCFQPFQGGAVYWSPFSGAHVVLGSIGQRWGQQGWEAGSLGYPVGSEVCGLRDGGCFQAFQGGAVYWSPFSGAHVVLGSIGQRWGQQGWEAGSLGYPVGSEVCGLRDGGCFQAFQGGAVYWSPFSGAHVVLGSIGQRWGQQGWEAGSLGYPVGSEVCGLRDGGCFQPFQGGAVYWSPASGASPVGGFASALSNAWGAQGWERGRLGYPVEGPHFVVRGGVVLQQRFQGGLLVLDTRGRVVVR